MVRLKLFSLNDYLGLSTHPTVCKAVAEAALSTGNGKICFRMLLAHMRLTADLSRQLVKDDVEP